MYMPGLAPLWSPEHNEIALAYNELNRYQVPSIYILDKNLFFQ